MPSQSPGLGIYLRVMAFRSSASLGGPANRGAHYMEMRGLERELSLGRVISSSQKTTAARAAGRMGSRKNKKWKKREYLKKKLRVEIHTQ